MRQTIFTVRTTSGITFQVEASNYAEARQRASDPRISIEISRMIADAVSQVSVVEPSRGVIRGKLFFEDKFFR